MVFTKTRTVTAVTSESAQPSVTYRFPNPPSRYALCNSLWDALDLDPRSSLKTLPFQYKGWNMAAQQNASKSTDREVNSLVSGSNWRLTGSQNHRKWELKGNTGLYLTHSSAPGKISHTCITADRCLSNSIISPSNPRQCFCTNALLTAAFPTVRFQVPLLPFQTATCILDTGKVKKLLCFS